MEMKAEDITSYDGIEFCYVEILHKRATDKAIPKIGLFVGIRNRSEKATVQGESSTRRVKYISLRDLKEDTTYQLLNVVDYNVMTVIVGFKEKRLFTVFKADDVDQELAMGMLAEVVKTMRTEERMIDSDPELIDAGSYINIPKELLEMAEKIREANKPTTKTDTTTHTAGTSLTDYEKRQRAERLEKERQDALRQIPMLIERKSDKPATKDITQMKKAIIAIAAGELVPEVPPIPEVEEKKKEDDNLPKAGAVSAGSGQFVAG